jgi:hypothetical protein
LDTSFKPFWGTLDSYLDYLDNEFSGSEKSTWYEAEMHQKLKQEIIQGMNEAKHDDVQSMIFATYGIVLGNSEHVNLINHALGF